MEKGLYFYLTKKRKKKAKSRGEGNETQNTYGDDGLSLK